MVKKSNAALMKDINNNCKMHDRLLYIDIGAGIMILWVLLFHALQPVWGGEVIAHIPWLFYFMPWFFYKAGLLFQPKEIRTEWKNSAIKLLIPFAVWTFVGYMAHLGWLIYAHNLTWRTAIYSPMRSLFLSCAMQMNTALWFIPILFLVRGIGNMLLKKGNVIVWAIITLAISIVFRIVHIPLLPNWIGGTCWGLFCFMAGYALKNHEQNKCVVIAAVVGLALAFLFKLPASNICNANILTKIFYYPACLCGCIVFDNVSLLIERLCKSLNISKIGGGIGRNAMQLYLPHMIIFHLTYRIIDIVAPSWYGHWQGLLVCLIAYIIFIPLLNITINPLQDKLKQFASHHGKSRN